MFMKRTTLFLGLSLSLATAGFLIAQAPPGEDGPPRGPGPGGPGGGRGPGGPGGMGGVQPVTKIVDKFDRNGDGRLNLEERKEARAFLAKEVAEGRGRRGPGGRGGPPFGGGGDSPAAKPGPKVTVAEARTFPKESFYDVKTLRTLFFEFENADWEKELTEFHKTDVEVPAKLTVDGRVYPEVGVHFRGMSSYFMVGEGQKRSLNVSLDFANKSQKLGGYRTLNLLNAHEDPSFIRPVLFSLVAREYVPVPKANMVRVVINGESWGVYVSQEQFNKDFTQEWFHSAKGARWKVPGSPGGRGGLEYPGEDAASYKRIYDLKTKDSAKPWADLARMCRVLNETPPDQLEAALQPLLDIDGALKFLALDNALINNDGFWIRSSDYSLYEDEKGQFHVLPSDINETFSRPGGPGFGGGGPGGRGGPRGPGGPRSAGNDGPRDRPENPVEGARPESARPRRNADSGGPAGGPEGRPNRGGAGGGGGGGRINGVELDPLYSASDTSRALISKLLAVPKLRERYLAYERAIAEKWLDWDRLGPIVEELHALIAPEIERDTRKLESLEGFKASIVGAGKPESGDGGGRGFGPSPAIALKDFATQRRAYLLKQIPPR